MMKMMRILLSSLLVCLSSPAWAYVPPSQYILKKMAAKHSDVKGLRLRSMVSLIQAEDQGSGTRFRDVTYYNAATRTIRSVALHETDNVELFATERKSSTLDPVSAVLFDSNLKALTQSVRGAGIPVKTEEELAALPTEEERRGAETESLARYLGDVAWVIGKQDSTEPQLWIQQDTFLPLRLFFKSDEGWADVRFDKYRWVREFPYPRVIKDVRKDSKGFQAELTDLAVNPDLSGMRKPLTVHGFTSAGNSSAAALKDLIQRYYEVIR